MSRFEGAVVVALALAAESSSSPAALMGTAVTAG
jgi:hypothetical protein